MPGICFKIVKEGEIGEEGLRKENGPGVGSWQGWGCGGVLYYSSFVCVWNFYKEKVNRRILNSAKLLRYYLENSQTWSFKG